MYKAQNSLLWSFDFNNRFSYRTISAEVVAGANFLDERTLPANSVDIEFQALDVGVESCVQQSAQRYIFHTAFCGSTLLCRALTNQPKVMVLKEPEVLLQIARRQIDEGSAAMRPFLSHAIQELSTPWVDDGVTIIKPTNSVNRLLEDIQSVRPGKALLMYSNMEDFILSCCKKLPEAETRIRWMAQFLIHDSDLGKKLGVDKNQPFNFLEACILTWYAQMEYYSKAIAVSGGGQIAFLAMEDLLADSHGCVLAASDFLELNLSRRDLSEKIKTTFTKNSKSVHADYSPQRRKTEKAELKKRFSSLLNLAINWENEVIRPIATVPNFSECYSII